MEESYLYQIASALKAPPSSTSGAHEEAVSCCHISSVALYARLSPEFCLMNQMGSGGDPELFNYDCNLVLKTSFNANYF